MGYDGGGSLAVGILLLGGSLQVDSRGINRSQKSFTVLIKDLRTSVARTVQRIDGTVA